jgi:AraC-like DNA-binding protein
MVRYKKYSDIEIFEGAISKHRYPWHFHDCYTLILVEKGSINYELQDKSINVIENEVLIIEPFLVHRNSITEPTVYSAIFAPIEFFRDLGHSKIVTGKVSEPDVFEAILKIQGKIEINSDKKEIKALVSRLLELIHQNRTQKDEDSSSSVQTIANIDCDLTINELAEKAHLSKFHFQRKFKKTNGLTIGQLKQQEKTIKAKSLLEKGKLSTEVAHDLGFFDQSHFIKYFKKMWALTPKNFK